MFFRLCVRAPRTTRGPRAGGLVLGVPTVRYFRGTVTRKCYYLASRDTKQNGRSRAVYSLFRPGWTPGRARPSRSQTVLGPPEDGRPEHIRVQEVTDACSVDVGLRGNTGGGRNGAGCGRAEGWRHGAGLHAAGHRRQDTQTVRVPR